MRQADQRCWVTTIFTFIILISLRSRLLMIYVAIKFQARCMQVNDFEKIKAPPQDNLEMNRQDLEASPELSKDRIRYVWKLHQQDIKCPSPLQTLPSKLAAERSIFTPHTKMVCVTQLPKTQMCCPRLCPVTVFPDGSLFLSFKAKEEELVLWRHMLEVKPTISAEPSQGKCGFSDFLGFQLLPRLAMGYAGEGR